MPREPLLLVPGLMCDPAVWQPVLPWLSAASDCVIAGPGEEDSLSAMAQELLRAAPPRFALAGHSMGGRIALEMLRLEPGRISRVALLDTGYLARAAGAAGEDEARKRQALLDIARNQGVRAMATAWVQGMVHPGRLADAALIERIQSMFERKDADTFARQIRALLQRPDARDVLHAIRVPTLVLCGRQDSWAPVPQHAAMQALVPGAELVVVEDAGHMVPMERPERVAAALARWLRAG